jgi:hypothetical protein
LLRETGRNFTAAETGFLASLSGHLAEGLRRALLLTALSADPDGADAGLLVLAPDNSVQLGNSAAQRWLDEVKGADRDANHLPLVVHAVARRARLAAAEQATRGGDGPSSRPDTVRTLVARSRVGARRRT